MCGIVGLFSKSPEIEESLGEHLAAMLGQMSDRGPDSAGVAVYRDPAPTGASKVSLHSADHAEVKQMFETYRQLVDENADDEQRGELARRICSMLTVHAEIEHPTGRGERPSVQQLVGSGVQRRCPVLLVRRGGRGVVGGQRLDCTSTDGHNGSQKPARPSP